MAPFARASQFLRREVWTADLQQLPAARRALYRSLRICSLAVRGFCRDKGLHHASALSFDTVLGLVPFLAFCVAVLKSLGVYDDLIHKTVRPWIMDVTSALGDHGDGQLVTLRSAFFVVLDFVDRADLASLGVAGLAVLLYVTLGMLYSVEASMNHIFAAESARNVARKISDYAAILFITPICLAIAAAITAHARRWPWLGGGLALQLAAVLTMSFAFSMLYVVMPFTRVRLRSALLGGSVAGVLWYGVLALHVSFQVGVARYNALYSTFAAFPLFLIWLFMSWIVVLFGAELAAAYQNAAAFRYRILGGHGRFAERLVALRAMTEICRGFLLGRPPLGRSELGAELGVPDRALRSLLARLVDAGLVTRAERGGQPAYVPARDVEAITVADVVEALERDETTEPVEAESDADARIRAIIEALKDVQVRSRHNLTLRQLAEETERGSYDPPDSAPCYEPRLSAPHDRH